MIWMKIKRKNRLIIKYIGYMGIVFLLMFDLSFILFSCTEDVKVDPDVLHSNTPIVVQQIAPPSNPPLSLYKGKENPLFGGMGEAIPSVEIFPYP